MKAMIITRWRRMLRMLMMRCIACRPIENFCDFGKAEREWC